MIIAVSPLACVAVDAPTGLTAAAGDRFIRLDWDDSDEGALDGYNIYRSTSSNSLNSSFITVSSSDYVDTAVLSSNTYYYAVSASLTNHAESAKSSIVYATPFDLPPAPPTGLVATVRYGAVLLDWDDNTEKDLSSYSLYRSTTSNQYGSALVSNRTLSTYTDGTVSNGTTYYYVVSAVDAGGNESGKSTEVSVWREGYDVWSFEYGVGAGTNDFDADGFNNLHEYGLDGNPTNGLGPTNLPVFSRFGNGLIYVHPQRSDDFSLVYIVETTTNLTSGSWTNAGYTVTGTNVTGDPLDFVTNDIETSDSEKYIRLKIEQ